MPVFGLVGRTLSHSFSKAYFEKKFRELGLRDYSYQNFELADMHGFRPLLSAVHELRGLNVTFPYKEAVMEYLDELSPEAREVGAVNCISVSKGMTTGYNTDVYGFSQSIRPFLDRHHERALLLGTGGASRAVACALRSFGIPVFHATSDPAKKRNNVMLYGEVTPRVMEACKLVVNCTPLGMYPREDLCPDIPYESFTAEHLAYDLVYNPAETLFLRRAREAGASTLNGLSMLHLQAEKSWEIWSFAGSPIRHNP